MSGLAEVQIREDCPDCENGVVQSAAWEVFNGDDGREVRERAEQLRREGRYDVAIEAELQWFRERGWTVAPRDGYGEGFPSEEETCSECEGTGKRTRWVTVRELSGMLWLREALAEEEA